jgi:hypothetical protein
MECSDLSISWSVVEGRCSFFFLCVGDFGRLLPSTWCRFDRVLVVAFHSGMERQKLEEIQLQF